MLYVLNCPNTNGVANCAGAVIVEFANVVSGNMLYVLNCPNVNGLTN